MHQRKYFTLNFLLMKYFLPKIFRTTVYIYIYIYIYTRVYIYIYLLGTG